MYVGLLHLPDRRTARPPERGAHVCVQVGGGQVQEGGENGGHTEL